MSQAIHYLQQSIGGVLYDPDEDEIPLGMFDRRAEMNKVLDILITAHIYPAVTMGQGHTGSEDKVSGGCHQMSLEVWNTQHFVRHIDEYQSFTSDMGTEVKVSDFVFWRDSLNLHMPSWMASRDKRLFQVESSDAGDYLNPLVQCEGEEFLRNALPLPGANHLIHTVAKGLNEAMSYYDTFLNQLRVLEKVLTHPGRNERLVAKCMLGTPWSDMVSTVKGFSKTLHDPRWHSVVYFCKAVLRPTAVLRKCWNERVYSGNGSHDLREREWSVGHERGKKFIPAELTAVLRDPMFRFFLHMILFLKKVPTKAAQWFDGCPCHSELIKGKSAYQRKQALIAEGLSAGICYCSSCRGWEVVDGKLEALVAELSEIAKRDLEILVAERCSDGGTDDLTSADMNLIMSNFQSGIALLQAGFTVKLSFSKHLPYLLMGLSHPVPSRQQHFAKLCLDYYQAGVSAGRRQHWKSIAFLKEGSATRADVDRLAETGVMSLNLQTQVAPMLLMPFGDRQIEMEHKPLSDIARPKSRARAGDIWSVVRIKKVERSLADASWRDAFLKHFLSIGTAREMIRALGFEGHPYFNDYMSSKARLITGEKSRQIWAAIQD